MALVGENGAGKTNLLEALSLFMPGRGLRRAELADMPRQAGTGAFAISITLDTPSAIIVSERASSVRIATVRAMRICRIDGACVSSPRLSPNICASSG